MSNIQTGAERMPHDLSHLGFLAGQIGRLITISTTPVIAGDSFEMDAVGALRLSPLRRGDRKSGSAGMPRPISYAVFCLKKKRNMMLISGEARREFGEPLARSPKHKGRGSAEEPLVTRR